MVSLIAFICVLEPVRQREKNFQKKNIRFFSFKCLIFDFSQKCSSYNSVWIRIRIRIRTFLFGFGFGSSQNIRIISDSDSDPQHWLLRNYFFFFEKFYKRSILITFSYIKFSLSLFFLEGAEFEPRWTEEISQAHCDRCSSVLWQQKEILLYK
jgi:hypothetical protein